ncbi:hypothetical protein IMG5_174350 [Ichthyophthirius multifiliis]|uniref:BRCT domain-containing protein n=1 Tax=Ichthyophthirius multifiliis TaxID=5932 RepID=G0R217_ICHMU|nr:hypothetical protein IMG5_174350 [Ichthyophthirius multifiliis]EGR28481.1 hypothetical protein IMG5_174350 [Ichthyophthirius multifiliis]|eukprot:XP_004029717.1 hypothetical protein IMG5_174350 [Ichthyophthirius multifiliis]
MEVEDPEEKNEKLKIKKNQNKMTPDTSLEKIKFLEKQQQLKQISEKKLKKSEQNKPNNFLLDKVIYVDVKTNDGENISESFYPILESLGAQIKKKFSNKINIMIWKANLQWLEQCQEQKKFIEIKDKYKVIVQSKNSEKSSEKEKILLITIGQLIINQKIISDKWLYDCIMLQKILPTVSYKIY